MRLLNRDDTDHNTTYVTLDEHQEAEAAWSVTYLERDALLRENATLLRQRDELAEALREMRFRPICPVCHTPGCIEARGPNFHASPSFGKSKCDYTGIPPFADAEWAGKENDESEYPMCEWCAGTGHPYGDESYGMCECPALRPNA